MLRRLFLIILTGYLLAACGPAVSATPTAAATTAIFFLVLALNILGDRLRDALDPRLKNA